MLSYQHAYHAGNLADVHKHAVLAAALDYLTRKDKPLSYLETHAGRGLYDLAGAAAQKTGEAARGIGRIEAALPRAHPYARALRAVRAAHGATAYPGSPLLARQMLRDGDKMHLAELHPAEHAALQACCAGPGVRIHHRDGIEMAQSLCPPEPRRGLMLIDPSWEVKRDYETVPDTLRQLARKWNVGVLMLWYPLLEEGIHAGLRDRLQRHFPQALCHEVRFARARPGHRMVGSGLFVVNPPWGLAQEAQAIGALLQRHAPPVA